MIEKRHKLIKITSSHIITFSFLIVILIGAFFLSLPISNMSGKSMNFVDALFTATSAVCVTGLTVVNTLNNFTLFGKTIILIMIQIGALGFMSLFILVLVALGKRITLKGRILIQESFNLSTFKGMVMFLKKIITGTFIIEGIGALVLSIRFVPEYGFFGGIYRGIFHSVSAFCNAGFDILGNTSLIKYQTDYLVNITIMILIILGGLGFSVWLDASKYIKKYIKEKRGEKVDKFRVSLHTKLTLSITIILILTGAILTFLLEYNNSKTLAGLSMGDKVLSSFFQSVTLRTAGFDSIGQVNMTDGSKFLSVLFMAIGGSPGGTAGGIKTVTLGAVILAVVSIIKGKEKISIFGKSISFYTVQKALSVVIMMISFIFIATIILTITERGHIQFGFLDMLFEVTSALGTVGLSTGLTPSLSVAGRIVIIICMFVGRLGPITVALALSFDKGNKKNVIHYPEEKIIVG